MICYLAFVRLSGYPILITDDDRIFVQRAAERADGEFEPVDGFAVAGAAFPIARVEVALRGADLPLRRP